MSNIYFIQAGGVDGPIKIGFSSNVAQRLEPRLQAARVARLAKDGTG